MESDNESNVSDNELESNNNESDTNLSNNTDTDSKTNNDTYTDSKTNNDTDEEIDDEPVDGFYYQIPILMCPCDKLKKKKLTDENKLIQEIIKHYQQCGKCDITNNNKTDIYFGNNKTKIYIEKLNSEDGDLINMMNCYDNCKVYQIKENEIRIIIIDDVSDLYNECIIIGWNKMELM